MSTPRTPLSPLPPEVAHVVSAAIAADGSTSSWDPDPHAHREHGYPLGREQCEILYLLARATGARRIVEFATSIGISTLYLAAAVRDNGGGVVVGAELVPEKVATARANLEAAGLSRFAEIREGDGRQTLADVGGSIDLFLLDGWPTGATPSIDRQVLDVVVPQFRTGTLLLDDNSEPDVIEYLRDPAHGFLSLPLPIQQGTFEMAVYTR